MFLWAGHRYFVTKACMIQFSLCRLCPNMHCIKRQRDKGTFGQKWFHKWICLFVSPFLTFCSLMTWNSSWFLFDDRNKQRSRRCTQCSWVLNLKAKGMKILSLQYGPFLLSKTINGLQIHIKCRLVHVFIFLLWISLCPLHYLLNV